MKLIKDFKLKLFKVLTLMIFVAHVTACSTSDNSVTASQPSGLPPWDSIEACHNQQYDAGIPGNIYCPYRGQNINGQVEAFAQIQAGAAIYLDFGLQYNDACPAGYVPIFEYIYGQKRLKDCQYIGEDYVDNVFYQHHNTSSCNGGYAGDQNCIPDFP